MSFDEIKAYLFPAVAGMVAWYASSVRTDERVSHLREQVGNQERTVRDLGAQLTGYRLEVASLLDNKAGQIEVKLDKMADLGAQNGMQIAELAGTMREVMRSLQLVVEEQSRVRTIPGR